MEGRSLIEWANVVACCVFFVWLFVIAYRMPPRGMWAARLTTWGVAIATGFQAVSPFYTSVPDTVWHGSMLHACGAFWTILFRDRIWAFLESCFPESS